MYAGTDWSDIEPGETDVFSIEWTNSLAGGATISAPVWVCFVSDTAPGIPPDPTPGNHISGPANVTTSQNSVTGELRTFSNQLISGMLTGNYYTLQCTVEATDPDGLNPRTLQMYSRVWCREAT